MAVKCETKNCAGGLTNTTVWPRTASSRSTRESGSREQAGEEVHPDGVQRRRRERQADLEHQDPPRMEPQRQRSRLGRAPHQERHQAEGGEAREEEVAIVGHGAGDGQHGEEGGQREEARRGLPPDDGREREPREDHEGEGHRRDHGHRPLGEEDGQRGRRPAEPRSQVDRDGQRRRSQEVGRRRERIDVHGAVGRARAVRPVDDRPDHRHRGVRRERPDARRAPLLERQRVRREQPERRHPRLGRGQARRAEDRGERRPPSLPVPPPAIVDVHRSEPEERRQHRVPRRHPPRGERVPGDRARTAARRAPRASPLPGDAGRARSP